MQLNRVLVEWAGPQIQGAAVSVLHYAGDVGPADPAAIVAAFTTLAPALPLGVTIEVPGSGDVIEDTTGELVDVWTAAGGATVNASGGAACAAGVGASIEWITGGIIGGRRLRGRTFLVPLTGTAYDTTGTITGPALGTLDDFGDDMLASGPLAVWHRPTTSGGSDGNSYGVTSFRIRDKVAVLRSRRD